MQNHKFVAQKMAKLLQFKKLPNFNPMIKCGHLNIPPPLTPK